YPLVWRSIAGADFLVTLPDSWPLQYDTVGGTLGTDNNAVNRLGNPDGTQVTQITLPGLNLPSVNNPSPGMRIVMFSIDGVTSQIRNITSINGTTVIWTEDIDGTGTYTTAKDVNNNGYLDNYPLPLNFVNAGVGMVRIELQERRYTW